jgi:hypothetical protein
MAVPTTGTSVFLPYTYTGTGSSTTITITPPTNSPPDLLIGTPTNNAGYPRTWYDRLRGTGKELNSANTSAEQNTVNEGQLGQNNFTVDGYNGWLNSSGTNIALLFSRAPGFFDEVCYTGTGATLALTHNLTVAPELIIGKRRTGGSYWILGGNFGASTYWYKNAWGANDSSTSSSYSGGLSFGAQPTSTTVTLDNNSALNVSGYNAVLWMWATCAGVSKVGTYTGNGTTQAIACGFTGGARFVLITRVGVVGDNATYVYDTARGMTTLTDPYLLLDTTAAQTATLGSVTTTTGGFTVNASILSAINTSGGSYIFLAIA